MNRVSTSVDSTILPRYMTMTLSQKDLTTLKSWLMKRNVVPNLSPKYFMRFNIWALMEMSREDTASSATTNFG